MTDGILDLLTAILVLGIVIAIAFGFILPLTDTEFMQFDSQYQDKGAMMNEVDYGNLDAYGNITRRMYTAEELILLLYVQDTRMEEPKSINLRNLVTGVDLSHSGYGENGTYIDCDDLNCVECRGLGYQNGSVNINDYKTMIARFQDDEAFHALYRYAENSEVPILKQERSETLIDGDVTEPNIGVISISDGYDVNCEPILNELNGAESGNKVVGDHAFINTNYQNDVFRLTEKTVPLSSHVDSKNSYDKKRIYYISHHFAVPNDSKYIETLSTDLQRIDDEKPSYFVEIQGEFYRYGFGKTYVDTAKGYDAYLTKIRASIDRSK